MRAHSLTPLILLALCATANAQPVVNPPMAIDRQVSVQLIQVANTDGSIAAPLFGTASEQAEILSFMDTIWAQAGIDINIQFRAGTYNSTFANTGTAGSNNPRPTSDLNTIISQAGAAGVLSPNPNTLNMFMVRIVPGFSQTSDNTSNGLAILGGNGITAWAGPNLTGFTGGRDVIASVLAHEIGHNLNLNHIVEAQNLMQEGGSANPGDRLNATQIATARSSQFAVVIPEPASVSFLVLAGLAALGKRRRRAA